MKKVIIISVLFLIAALSLITAAACGMEQEKAVLSGKQVDFKASEVAAGPFDSKENALEEYKNQLPAGLEIVPPSPKGTAMEWFVVKVEPVIGTGDLEKVSRIKDDFGNPAIAFSLTDGAAEKFKTYTTANIGKKLALLFDNRVLSAPIVQSVLSKDGVITGRFTVEEVDEMVMQLRTAIKKK